MKVIRAEHLGMCFGVRDAIALALERAEAEPLTVLGDLVHNESVLAELRAKGLRMERQPEDVDTRAVMITAHGASRRRIAETRRLGLDVLEATCPLVKSAHQRLEKMVRQGFHPVIIGRQDHVEVRGLTEDLAEFDVVLSEEDIARLRPRERFGIVSQTTQPIDKVRGLVRLLRLRFPGAIVQFADTVCQPTKQRQTAALELSRRCDVIVVIGGAHSNNTQELVKTCSRHCSRIHHVQTADELCNDWFSPDDVVGITAGTSTPDAVIEAVETRLCQLAFASVNGAPKADQFRATVQNETVHH
ncbi:MAG TPA: 4-hydroxy-3-methylbut-2-enyl diphosphate reductase [Verrucomicrobiae bacterium]|nr:4-hydroxy-3-methylbut-2-enyl diphosphate reductase [Verrucomicrobiae bacterium]